MAGSDTKHYSEKKDTIGKRFADWSKWEECKRNVICMSHKIAFILTMAIKTSIDTSSKRLPIQMDKRILLWELSSFCLLNV